MGKSIIRPRYFKRSKKKVEPEKEKTQEKLFSKFSHQEKPHEEHQKAKHTRPRFQKPTHSVINRDIFGNSKLMLKKMKLQWAAIAVLVILGILWNYIAGSLLITSFHSWLSLLEQREKLSEAMNLWANIAKEYPNYRDAYVEGAIYAYRLGDTGKEQYFISQLQLLDPNYPLTKTLEQLTNLQSLNQ